MVLSALAFASIPGFAVSGLVVLAVSVAARIRPWELLKGSRPLLVVAAFIVLVKTVQPGSAVTTEAIAEGFAEGVIAALRLFVPFTAAALLFAVSTMRELRHSLAVVEL
jgi:biotin transport system permease protein